MSRLARTCDCEREEWVRLEGVVPASDVLRACPAEGCERQLKLDLSGLETHPQGGVGLRACASCGHPELYTRKDFPPALGITIVVVAALLVPVVPYYLSLLAAAILDALLFRLAPDVVVCYRCAGQHRGFAADQRHPPFDRTIEERLLFGEKAVMGSPMRPGGTAGAPDPEH